METFVVRVRKGALSGPYRRLSLRAKFAAHLAASVTLLFGTVITVGYLHSQAALEQARHRGFQLAKIFAHASVQAVADDDFLLMRHAVNSIASEPDVLYAMIQDRSGRVRLHSDVRETGRVYTDALSMRAVRAEAPVAQELASGYDFAIPVTVLNELRAVARIGLSFDTELTAIRRTRNLILGLGCVALLASFLLARLQARTVTAAVERLVSGADEIGRGNLDHRISVDTGDELGQLALAFNKMTDSVQAFIETSRQLSSALDMDTVLQSIAVYARNLVAADVVAIAPVDPTPYRTTVRVALGARTDQLEGLRVTPGLGMAGLVLETGDAVVTSDYRSDSRFVHDPGHDRLVEEEGIVSSLAVPILRKDAVIGILLVGSRTARTFSPEEINSLRQMAHQAAIAMENARLYEDLKRSNEELCSAQEELVRRARMATIGEVAAAVAHEVRNPLGALSNCIQMLRKNPDITGEDAELLAIIDTEARRLNGIIAGLLEVRARPPRFEDVPLHDTIVEAMTRLRRDGRWPAAIAFHRDFDPAMDTLRADQEQLSSVFTNLFLNAIQAMDRQGELRVETRRVADRVEIRVQDSGPGISPAVGVKIFDAFYTTKASGIGLGLAIVRRIVEDHGGHITLEPRPEVGACFVLSLALRTQGR